MYKPEKSSANLHNSSKNIKICACIDLDAFYAQVDAKRLGIDERVPFCVLHYRYIASCNYAARAFGVKKGSSIEEAKRLCPQIVVHETEVFHLEEGLQLQETMSEQDARVQETYINKLNTDPYKEESEKYHQILKSCFSIVEKASIDEVYIDLTSEVLDHQKRNDFEANTWKGKISEKPSDEEILIESEIDLLLMIGTQLIDQARSKVRLELGYTCSAGISYNKLLAKLGSNLQKPNG